MEINWTDRVENEEVLYTVKEEGNILHTIQGRKANWNGHIMRRIYLLKYVIQEKSEGTKRRGTRRNSYWMTLRKDKTLELGRGSTRSPLTAY